MEESEGRNENDFYATPTPLAHSICQRLVQMYPAPDYLIEPSAGSGAFISPASLLWQGRAIHAIELREEERQSCVAAGASSFTSGDWPIVLSAWQPEGRPLILGNPPFSFAEQHIQAVLDYMLPGTVLAFYLKLNFMGATKRVQLWGQGQLRYLIPVLGRPSFKTTKKASNDTNEYGMFIWEVGYAGKAEILFPHISWKVPRGKGKKAKMSDLQVRKAA